MNTLKVISYGRHYLDRKHGTALVCTATLDKKINHWHVSCAWTYRTLAYEEGEVAAIRNAVDASLPYIPGIKHHDRVTDGHIAAITKQLKRLNKKHKEKIS